MWSERHNEDRADNGLFIGLVGVLEAYWRYNLDAIHHHIRSGSWGIKDLHHSLLGEHTGPESTEDPKRQTEIQFWAWFSIKNMES